MARKRPKGHPVSVSIREYARGAAGGLLFSLPLLYTMETWELGSLASPVRLIAGLSGTFVLLLGYNRYAGLRQEASVTEIAIDSIEELGLGLAGAACILWLLGRLTSDMSPVEIVNRVVIQGLIGAIGVSIGTASKALNAAGRLKQETREKVLAAAQELGFRPNAMAQSLHRAKSMTVGILSTDSFGRFTFPIVEALEERLAEHGIAVFMCNATDDPAREK